MNVCLIGDSLITLSLAKNLTNKNIKVFNYVWGNKKKSNTRTIGITSDNFKFFNKEILNIKKKMIWDIEKINVYSEKYKKQKILNFEDHKKSLFYMIKDNEIYTLLEKNLKKNFLYKKICLNNNNLLKKITKKNFDLIINCDQNNVISKELFFKKIKKQYNSKAFTCIINHKPINNKTASQIFTKHGPIALIDKDMPVIAINPKTDVFEKVYSNLEEVKARKGKLFLFTDNFGRLESRNLTKAVFEMPTCASLLEPIVYSLPIQLLAYFTALDKGTDVDQPRNLAKSVTVE